MTPHTARLVPVCGLCPQRPEPTILQHVADAKTAPKSRIMVCPDCGARYEIPETWFRPRIDGIAP